MGDLEGEAPRDRRIEHLAEASGLISKKWDAAILYALLEDGPLRFNELKERLGTVSAKVLSESLDDLGSADLVERRVLSESPLRVEYATSAAGEDMRPVIEGLVEWSEEHVAGDRPLVVVADDDRRIAGMHAEWLDEEYRVETCSAPADVLTATDETPDVAVLDRGLSESDLAFFGRVRDAVDGGVVALTNTPPSADDAELGFDAYLVKPVDPSELRSAVETVLSRFDRDRDVREFLSLQSRRRAIEAATTASERADNDKYQRLTDRLETLRDRIDEEELPDGDGLPSQGHA